MAESRDQREQEFSLRYPATSEKSRNDQRGIGDLWEYHRAS